MDSVKKKKHINFLMSKLKTGDYIYLDDGVILRYDDTKFKVNYLIKIEPRIKKTKRQFVIFLKRRKNMMENELIVNPEYKSQMKKRKK